jgi:hypothetical protein
MRDGKNSITVKKAPDTNSSLLYKIVIPFGTDITSAGAIVMHT